jgi:hypothetical protein
MNFLVCGTRGTGKSTLALYIAKKFGGTVIVYDPRGSYSQAGIQVESAQQLQKHLEDQDYITEKGEIIPLVYHVDSDPEESFNELCRVIFPAQFRGFSGRVALVVDESRNLQSSHFINDQLNRAVGQAPLEDVLIIQTTHEIKEWNSKSKSVMDQMFLFYQIGPKNCELVKEFCGEEVAQLISVEFRPKSGTDPKRHYCVRYCFNHIFEDGKQWEVWDDPEMWYTPLGEQNRLPGNRGE